MIFRTGDTSRHDIERRKRITFVVFWAAVFLAVVVAFRSIMKPFVMALVLAYVLSPVVARLSRVKVGTWQPQRWLVVVMLYVVMLTGLTVTVVKGAPALVEEARNFARDEVPQLRREIETNVLPRIREFNNRFLRPSAQSGPQDGVEATREQSVLVQPRHNGEGYRITLPEGGITVERGEHEGSYRVVPARHQGGRRESELAGVMERVRAFGSGHTGDLLRVGRGIIGGIIGGIFGFFITLMLSAYILLTEDKILGFLRSLVRPESRAPFDELLSRIDRGLSGVVRGQLIICGVNGVLSAIGFAIAGLKYWPLLALIATVFSLIPIFGAILSSVPAVAIGLTQGLGTGLFVLAWILGIHQIEANLLNPKIMGDAAKIHPVLVVFSLLAGEHFFGILGALLAVPAMSLVQSVFLHWRKYALSYGDPTIARDSLTPPTVPPGEITVRGGGSATGSTPPSGA